MLLSSILVSALLVWVETWPLSFICLHWSLLLTNKRSSNTTQGGDVQLKYYQKMDDGSYVPNFGSLALAVILF